MTIEEIFKKVKTLLQKDFILSPETEARIIVKEVLNLCLKDFLLLQKNYNLNPVEEKKIYKIVKKRLKGKSLASIIQKKEFFEYEFFVNKDVLIPRPESELLIEIFLDKIEKTSNYNILDIGCGSGCLSIVLANYYENSLFYAIDKSKKALKVAKKNIGIFCKNKNIILLHKDFFKYKPDFRFDVIISNPPYIPYNETKFLLKSKQVSDPIISLNGGNDGLNFYRHLFRFACDYLKDQGVIIIEHGYRQQDSIIEIFKNNYIIERFKDFANNARALALFKK